MRRAEIPGALRRYAAERADRDREVASGEAGAVRRWLSSVLPRSAREALRRSLTRLIAPYSRRRARALERRGPLRLHLGCGPTRLPGWVNLDLVGSRADLYWHLGAGLPFADGSARAVFAEHLLEHLSLEGAIGLVEEAARVLAPGGVLRVGVPDFRRYAAAYLGRGELIERYRPGRPTPLLAVSEVAFLHGHRSLWDEETLAALLTEAGFRRPAARASGESSIRPAPDSPRRRVETLYVEAVR